MSKLRPTMAQRVAQAASAFQHKRTGHAPEAVTAVLSEDTQVITLHGALTPAEQAMATNSVGAAQLQEFHRRLFADSVPGLRQEIKRITGVEVREAAQQAALTTGTAVHVFTNGTIVQMFLLAQPLSSVAWNGNVQDGRDSKDPRRDWFCRFGRDPMTTCRGIVLHEFESQKGT